MFYTFVHVQKEFFNKAEKSYGGELLKKRKGRISGRPIVTRQTMHLVLRSSLANGKWSFLEPKNKAATRDILKKFATKYGVKLLYGANVGNHIHLEIQLTNRYAYKPFIRAITAAIAMKITGVSRWKTKEQVGIKKFWDLRPFTRVVTGWKARLSLKDYIKINRLEGQGIRRGLAKVLIQRQSGLLQSG